MKSRVVILGLSSGMTAAALEKYQLTAAILATHGWALVSVAAPELSIDDVVPRVIELIQSYGVTSRMREDAPNRIRGTGVVAFTLDLVSVDSKKFFDAEPVIRLDGKPGRAKDEKTRLFEAARGDIPFIAIYEFDDPGARLLRPESFYAVVVAGQFSGPDHPRCQVAVVRVDLPFKRGEGKIRLHVRIVPKADAVVMAPAWTNLDAEDGRLTLLQYVGVSLKPATEAVVRSLLSEFESGASVHAFFGGSVRDVIDAHFNSDAAVFIGAWLAAHGIEGRVVVERSTKSTETAFGVVFKRE